ncbi:MAG: hypothetical protein OXS28_22575 [Gammaproteobacteria bacterium]|nr:hypothetical protein [Gammaproteobacteria bacterium]
MTSTPMYRALLKAGVDEELATLAADEITEPAQVANKSDLLDMKVELIKWMAGLHMMTISLIVVLLKLI